ncbi:MAG TPA: hypothetical protein VNG90_02175 [Candidatus Acidoferrum sp.]|nr:hypothetical protein [Candidatus Acidoferrum sp.]
MNNKKQVGFGVVEIVVGVLIVAVLAYGGYRLYGHFSKPTSTTDTNTSSSRSSTSSNTTPQVTYLDIKELGIKIQLSDSIKDAIYSYNAPTSQTRQTSPTFGGDANISTQTLANKDAACGLSKGDPLGTVVKWTGDTDNSGNVLTANNTTVFKLGGNYYRYEGPQTACSDDSSINLLATEQIAAFREAFKTVQLDN